ncbi:unnamed protein product, partial [Amoebophrya sp. A25]|eukprot:GSA25T00024583001.1
MIFARTWLLRKGTLRFGILFAAFESVSWPLVFVTANKDKKAARRGRISGEPVPDPRIQPGERELNDQELEKERPELKANLNGLPAHVLELQKKLEAERRAKAAAKPPQSNEGAETA